MPFLRVGGLSAALGQGSSLDVDFIVRCRHGGCHLHGRRYVLDAASRKVFEFGAARTELKCSIPIPMLKFQKLTR
jgi:hypothetical protein